MTKARSEPQPSEPFTGFDESGGQVVPLPEMFFNQLIHEIDSLAELKLLLYVFWRREHVEGIFRFFRRQDFTADENFMLGLARKSQLAEQLLDDALQMAVKRGTLLQVDLATGASEQTIYCLNTPRGRVAVAAILRGDWVPELDEMEYTLPRQVPNIYKLYEENIGPLTPMIADMLREAEDTYPQDWIRKAIQIAVQNNARSWRYVEAVLNRWQTEGTHGRKDRRDSPEARRKYAEWDTSE